MRLRPVTDCVGLVSSGPDREAAGRLWAHLVVTTLTIQGNFQGKGRNPLGKPRQG